MSSSSERATAQNLLNQKLASLDLKLAEAIEQLSGFTSVSDGVLLLSGLKRQIEQFRVSGSIPTPTPSKEVKGSVFGGKVEVLSDRFLIDGIPIKEFVTDLCREHNEAAQAQRSSEEDVAKLVLNLQNLIKGTHLYQQDE